MIASSTGSVGERRTERRSWITWNTRSIGILLRSSVAQEQRDVDASLAVLPSIYVGGYSLPIVGRMSDGPRLLRTITSTSNTSPRFSSRGDQGPWFRPDFALTIGA